MQRTICENCLKKKMKKMKLKTLICFKKSQSNFFAITSKDKRQLFYQKHLYKYEFFLPNM